MNKTDHIKMPASIRMRAFPEGIESAGISIFIIIRLFLCQTMLCAKRGDKGSDFLIAHTPFSATIVQSFSCYHDRNRGLQKTARIQMDAGCRL